MKNNVKLKEVPFRSRNPDQGLADLSLLVVGIKNGGHKK